MNPSYFKRNTGYWVSVARWIMLFACASAATLNVVHSLQQHTIDFKAGVEHKWLDEHTIHGGRVHECNPVAGFRQHAVILYRPPERVKPAYRSLDCGWIACYSHSTNETRLISYLPAAYPRAGMYYSCFIQPRQVESSGSTEKRLFARWAWLPVRQNLESAKSAPHKPNLERISIKVHV
jgi:hypothetical protein